MTQIQFYVSVDGSKPQPIDTYEIVALIKMVDKFANVATPSPMIGPANSEGVTTRPFPSVPAAGERALDYMIKAAETLAVDQPTSYSELGDIMVRMGWQTTTIRGAKRNNVLRQTAKNDKLCRFHANGDGTVVYRP